MTRFKTGLIALIVLPAVLATTAQADVPLAQSKYLRQAAIRPAAARTAAMAAQPGTIVAEELEKEAGGSGLRYSFDIKTASNTHEVGIDAMTGKLLENSIEGTHPD